MALTILAILAALLIPALTGYIRKAKEKAIITEATDTWKAAQAAMSECYAMYPESFTNPDPTKPPCQICNGNRWQKNKVIWAELRTLL